MQTVGTWPQKSAASAECVTTHRPNRAASKMDGASIGRPIAGRRGSAAFAADNAPPTGRGATRSRRSSFSRTGRAVACAYRGCSSLNFGRIRRAGVEKVSRRSSNETGLVAPEPTAKAVRSAAIPRGRRVPTSVGARRPPVSSRRAAKGKPAKIPVPGGDATGASGRAFRTRGRAPVEPTATPPAGRRSVRRPRRFSSDVKARARRSRLARRCRATRRKGSPLWRDLGRSDRVRENPGGRVFERRPSVPRTASGLRG